MARVTARATFRRPMRPYVCSRMAIDDRRGRDIAARRAGRLRGADQAADHRAAARDHRADHGRGQGDPLVWLMVATVVGGALAAGGANAINMVVDRDIDKVMHRTRNRPLVTGVSDAQVGRWSSPSPSRSSAFGELVALGQPALGRPCRLGYGLLRLRLHAVAQAALEPEHRHRRRRRCRAGARRMGGGHRPPRLAAGRPLRHHLHLDAAALLGPGRPIPRRLRGGRRADAAGGRLAASGPPSRSSSTPWCCGRSDDPLRRGRPPRGALCRSRPSCSAGPARDGRPSSTASSPAATARWRHRSDAAVPVLDHLPHAPLRRHGRRCPPQKPHPLPPSSRGRRVRASAGCCSSGRSRSSCRRRDPRLPDSSTSSSGGSAKVGQPVPTFSIPALSGGRPVGVPADGGGHARPRC